jgi:hypothetical protein
MLREATDGLNWRGRFLMDGDLFVYLDRNTARIVSVLGYPTAQIAKLG